MHLATHPRAMQDLAPRGDVSWPPQAGAGCQRPHPRVAREGPAWLNINPGAVSRAPRPRGSQHPHARDEGTPCPLPPPGRSSVAGSPRGSTGAGNEPQGSTGRRRQGRTDGQLDRWGLPGGDQKAGEVRRVMGTLSTCPFSPAAPEESMTLKARRSPATWGCPGSCLSSPLGCFLPAPTSGRDLLPTHPWAGAASTATLSAWPAETLVTSCHQDQSTAPFPACAGGPPC